MSFGKNPAYLSIDIDGMFGSPRKTGMVETNCVPAVLDPSLAPTKGIPESSGLDDS